MRIADTDAATRENHEEHLNKGSRERERERETEMTK